MQKYIDLGWHTVPLSGKLERLDDGTKTIPKFESNWREKYQKTKNKKVTSIGGAITGRCSGIVAIDCDNTSTWNLFRALDPDNELIFISKGKGYEAGTLIYKYDAELATNFSIQDNNLALDFYSDNGFVYLPTKSNKTKVPLENPTEPVEMPHTVKTLLLQLAKKDSIEVPKTVNSITASCLNPLVSELVKNKKYMAGLFRIITPKDFRKCPQYVSDGHLHPNDIPEGRGSEYLVKISAILGADISVDETLYVEAMHAINSMFDNPLDGNRLEKTILDPMLTRSSSINGVPIWKYEDTWSDYRLILQSKRQSALDLGFDDKRDMYYVVDEINQNYKEFARDNDMVSYVEAATVGAPNKKVIKQSIPILNVISDPAKQFGFIDGEDPTARELNTFKQTPELSIIRDPDTYAEKYNKPVTMLKYLETLIPDDKMREYVLGFLKTKFTTFKYSPVILYFIGSHGSGKDLFVSILEQIMGIMTRPTVKEFLEKYNGYMLDSYFVQLDEYGNQLTKVSDKDEALGKIKAYSGKPKITIRQMRTDGFDYYHHVTFIMTANKNPLMVEDGDRRVALVNTPNVLADAVWVDTEGGIGRVHDKIISEIKDFCYYLATQVKTLSVSDYMRAHETEDKLKLIANTMNAANRLAFCIKNSMTDYLTDLADEYNTPIDFNKGSIDLVDDLYPLYSEMTEHKGEQRVLTKVLKAHGVTIQPSSRDGIKIYNVRIPEQNPFKPDED